MEKYYCPQISDHLILVSKCNEDNTNKDIMNMGEKSALKGKKWIKEWCSKENFSKLLFIGLYLGGLIIRAALPYYIKKSLTLIYHLQLPIQDTMASSKEADTGQIIYWEKQKIRKQKDQMLIMNQQENHLIQ